MLINKTNKNPLNIKNTLNIKKTTIAIIKTSKLQISHSKNKLK